MSDNTLEHHGVKGQKWGVRRDRGEGPGTVRRAATFVGNNRGKIFIAASLVASGGLTLATLNADPSSSVNSITVGSNTDTTRLTSDAGSLSKFYGN